MKRYLGITAFIISSLAIILCFLIASDIIPTQFNFALSDFGVDPRTATIFNGGLIVAGVISLIYTLTYFKKFEIALKKFVVWFLVLVNICLIAIAVFPYNVNYEVHTIAALSYFFLFSIFFVVFGLLFKSNVVFKRLIFGLGILQFVLVVIFVSLHLSYAIGQIIQVFFAGVFYFGLFKIESK